MRNTTKQYHERMLKLLDFSLPREMLVVALKLAKNYGHEWGRFFDPKTIEPMSINQIEEISFDPEYDHYIGLPIFSPELRSYQSNHYGLYHTTGTGRLSWEIHNYGMVTLSIHRPGIDSVLKADVNICRPTGSTIKVCVEQNDKRIYQRHVDALVDALSALMPYQQALEACVDIEILSAEDPA